MNKTALITGASSGIGLAFAKLFAQKNYNLVLVSQSESNLKMAEIEVRKVHQKNRILTISKDLSQPSSPLEVYQLVKENSLTVDILVNNAGIQIYGNFHEVPLEDMERLMLLNMNSLVKMTHLFLTDMILQKSGKILNVGSTGSFQPCPLNAVYCATKGFVLYFSEGIGEELKGTGVTVTALCPGATDSNFAKRGNMIGTKLFSGKLQAADTVAEIGYKALMKGKPVVMTSLADKLTAFSVRLMPRSLVTKLGMQMLKK
ncbi:MAG: SDR family oxidoreductase [Clostridia bacterium]|nr:SDR family oxidoreductase [Clostridia bacterium]